MTCGYWSSWSLVEFQKWKSSGPFLLLLSQCCKLLTSTGVKAGPAPGTLSDEGHLCVTSGQVASIIFMLVYQTHPDLPVM